MLFPGASGADMRRREFLGLMGGVAVMPFAAHAQQRPVIGYFNSATPSTQVKNVAAFHRDSRKRV